MKSKISPVAEMLVPVTLHVRVWIEMLSVALTGRISRVTLHVRVWIEIFRELCKAIKNSVTLHVRVWIEILRSRSVFVESSCHPPREGVD